MICQCTFVRTTANDRDSVIQWIELFQADCLVRRRQIEFVIDNESRTNLVA